MLLLIVGRHLLLLLLRLPLLPPLPLPLPLLQRARASTTSVWETGRSAEALLLRLRLLRPRVDNFAPSAAAGT
ncbi:hypothetical protein F5X96DRAFT_652517 [Biscogniauxia mediterranea]|nr:hypothetical protein F5X96DRAFT_652517 [Biscogniauxia mediterranea]